VTTETDPWRRPFRSQTEMHNYGEYDRLTSDPWANDSKVFIKTFGCR